MDASQLSAEASRGSAQAGNIADHSTSVSDAWSQIQRLPEEELHRIVLGHVWKQRLENSSVELWIDEWQRELGRQGGDEEAADREICAQFPPAAYWLDWRRR